MRLGLGSSLALFAIGCLAGLVGDHAAVSSGTTRYLDTGGFPSLWGSPIFFAPAVGLATVATAELRLHLAPPRPDPSWERALGGVAAVLGLYVLTALLTDASTSSATALIACLAVIVFAVMGGGFPAVICGATAAVLGPAAEIIEAEAGVYEYTGNVDGLLGVGPWLVPLYFAFGVVCAYLGELAAARDG